jgi:hypothetical protein
MIVLTVVTVLNPVRIMVNCRKVVDLRINLTIEGMGRMYAPNRVLHGPAHRM